jgi:hypothetical protein
LRQLHSTDHGNSQTTFSATVKETLQLPVTSAPEIMPKAQESFSIAATKETLEILDSCPDVGEVLDELCKSVKGLDKYSAITKDTIGEKDGMFLPGKFQLFALGFRPKSCALLVLRNGRTIGH